MVGNELAERLNTTNWFNKKDTIGKLTHLIHLMASLGALSNLLRDSFRYLGFFYMLTSARLTVNCRIIPQMDLGASVPSLIPLLDQTLNPTELACQRINTDFPDEIKTSLLSTPPS